MTSKDMTKRKRGSKIIKGKKRIRQSDKVNCRDYVPETTENKANRLLDR
jgi:hypothetical protein